ncbi:uncharacterized protein [Amphiura filiformis]|uniref:uncharacterized protein n=1 Tax=Amphiura filiformis TaxID=82378 RepID=UPI003B20C1F1
MDIKVSDDDIYNLASNAKLSRDQLRHLFQKLGLVETDIENAYRRADTRDFKLQAISVLQLWRQINGLRATRQAIIDALKSCGFIEAKEILEKKWTRTSRGMAQIQPHQFHDVIEELSVSQLTKLFLKLGLNDREIENAKLSSGSNDVTLQAMEAFKFWVEINGPEATLEAVLEALKQCRFRDSCHKVEKKWKLTPRQDSEAGIQLEPRHRRIVKSNELIGNQQPISAHHLSVVTYQEEEEDASSSVSESASPNMDIIDTAPTTSQQQQEAPRQDSEAGMQPESRHLRSVRSSQPLPNSDQQQQPLAASSPVSESASTSPTMGIIDTAPTTSQQQQEDMGSASDNLAIVKKILTEATDIICDNLDPEILLRTMKAKGALTENDVSYIRNKITPDDKAEQMLSILMKKPVESYDIFMETLVTKERKDLYEQIKTIELRHGYGKASPRQDSEAGMQPDPRYLRSVRSSQSLPNSDQQPFSSQPLAASSSVSVSASPTMDIIDTAQTSSQQQQEDSLKLADMENWKEMGSQRKVFHVTFKDRFQMGFRGHKEAAVKRVDEDELAKNEISQLQKLNHPNIVTLLGVIGPNRDSHPPYKDMYYIIMELGDISLADYMEDLNKPLTTKMKFKWAITIAEAVKYLHDNRVVHRDLKPHNCILFKDDILKLCDFGLSRDASSTMTTAGRGTYVYTAPETGVDNPSNKDRKKMFSNKSDVYQVGCLLWELFARQLLSSPPYDKMPEMKADHRTIQPILEQCLKKDRSIRPEISDVLSGLLSASNDL